MKKVLSVFLSIMMLLSIIAGIDLSVYAATLTSGKCGDNVTYSFDSSTGTLTISGTGDMWDYCILPEDSSNSPFTGVDSIVEIIINDGVTAIGAGAFAACRNLLNVTIPDSVQSIGDINTFDSCCNLKSIIIPNGVTLIGWGVFAGCENLTSITIPDSVTNIDTMAFYNCTSLMNVTIPSSVEFIDSDAFFGCTNLTSITVDLNNKYYSSDDGILYSKDKTELIEYPAGKADTTFTIPDSVTNIGCPGFAECANLTAITIPDSVTNIGVSAFFNCTSLTSITIPNSVTSIGDSAFSGCTSLTSVIIPESVKSIGDFAFSDCKNLTRIIIQNKDCELGYGIPKVTTIEGYYGSSAQEYAEKYNCEFVAIDANDYDCENGIHCYNLEKTCLICGYSQPAIPIDNVIPIESAENFAEIKKEGDACFFSFIPEESGIYLFMFLGGYNVDIADTAEGMEFSYPLDVLGCLYDENMNEIASSKFCREIEPELSQNPETAHLAFLSSKLSAKKTYFLEFHFSSPNETGIIDVAPFYHSDGNHLYLDGVATYYDSCKAHVKYTCLVCGNTTIEDIEHYDSSVYEEEVEATCTTEGRYAGAYCSVCKEVIWGLETIPATGHSYGSGKVTKSATCTAAGIKTFTCTKCNATKTETIAATGHSYDAGKVTTAATCTAAGVKTLTCTKCNATKTEAISAKGHTVVTDKAVAATCTTAGKTAGSHCSVCNAVITAQKTVSATGHKSVTDKAVAATCTSAGKTEGSHCSVCNAVITAQKTIAATGHSYDSGKVTKSATCTANGVKTYTCTKCKATKTETIKAKGHTAVTDKAVAATCTTAGKTEGSHCSVCNAVIKAQTAVAATGHSYDSGKVTKAATCTASGTKTYTCTKCKATKTETIKAKGHTVVTDKAVSATCTKDGKTAGSHCSVCNTVIKKQETVKATGHSYDAGKITKAPTVTATGVKTYTCTKCKATKTETISKLKLSAPTLKVAVNSNGTFKMTWNKVTGAEKYEIYYKQTDGSYKLLKTVTGTSYTTVFAQYGKQYSYKMKAVTGNTKSDYSKVVNATNNKKLQTPTLKVSVNSNGTFKMTWNKVTGATSYQIYYKQADGSYKLLKTVTGTSYTSGFAQYGKQYSYKVRAVTSKNSSATSNFSSVVNAKNTKKLGTPTMKATVNKNGSFKLSWGKVTGATSYQIYWKQANGSYKLLKTVNGTSYTTVVAAKGKTYSYKVRAVTKNNSSATSNYSSVVSAKRK